MQVKISQAVRMITKAIQAKVVPMLHGSPGTGKSQIVYQIAEQFNLKVIDLRLSQCDPTDLAGFPSIEQVPTLGGKTRTLADYVPMAHFPIEGDELPIDLATGQRYAGWMLFLDEATSAPPAIQAASYKLVLDKMVGSHHLHKNVAMVLAGNLITDGAIVHEMSTALQSRMLHLDLVVDAVEWDEWAVLNGMDYRITSYIKYKPGNVYNFSADHTDKTYACPRTWEFLNRLLKVMDYDDRDFLPMAAGTIGEGMAREFIGFCRIHAELLKPEQIVANPEKVTVPSEPSILFALTGSIAHNMDLATGEAYMKFVSRLPVEFQVVCLRETVRRNKAMLAHASIQKWVTESANNLF